MESTFEHDWSRFCSLPFHLKRKYGKDVEPFLKLFYKHQDHPDHHLICYMREWVLSPFSLWRLPLEGAVKQLCKDMRAGQRLDADMVFLLEQMDDFPGDQLQ